MKQLTTLLFLCLALNQLYPQIKATFKGSISLKAEEVLGVDNYGTLYYKTQDDTFLKRSKDTVITYANFQLGTLFSANTFNPLKINLFYKEFNTVIVLDNRLTEITKIDFNAPQNYKNVSFISTGFDNTLWIYNQDTQRLELFDYRSNSTRIKTVPISDTVLDLKSDYNHCYLLTDQFLYIYSYFGTLTKKIKSQNFSKMAFCEGHIVLKNDEGYMFLSKTNEDFKPIDGMDLLINQFLVTNETLYLYRDNLLYQYQLKTD